MVLLSAIFDRRSANHARRRAHFYRPKPPRNVPIDMDRDVQTSSAFREAQTLGEDPKQGRLTRYRKDLDDAQRELEEEKHKPLGLFDDMLNLFCWIETPEERLHKNRLAEITIREVGRGSQETSAPKVESNNAWSVTPRGIVSGLANRMLLALAKAK